MYAPTAFTPVARMGYSRMPIVAGSLAEFIRGLGYHAIPCGNDTAISVPITIQAGLGHVGRHGRLITWNEGPMVRIAKIFTDLPLAPTPMAPEGIIEYCEVCKKCAKHCPSQSIPSGPRTFKGFTEANNPGVLRWFCNADTCYEYWREIGTVVVFVLESAASRRRVVLFTVLLNGSLETSRCLTKSLSGVTKC